MTMDFTVLWLIVYAWCAYACNSIPYEHTGMKNTGCEKLSVENAKICYEIYDADKGISIWWLARIKCRDGYTLELHPPNTTYPVCRIDDNNTYGTWKWTYTVENVECVPAEDETTNKPEKEGEDNPIIGVLMPLLVIFLVCVAIGVTLGVFLFRKNSSSMKNVTLGSGQNHQEQEQCGDNDVTMEAERAVFSIETEVDHRPSHRPYKSVGWSPAKPIHCGFKSMARNKRHKGHVHVHKLRGHKR